MIRPILPPLLLLPLILLLAACGGSGDTPEPTTTTAPRALPVQAILVEPRDLSRVVQVSSPVEPLRTIRLAARTEGVLTEVLVEEGDTVGAGQVLARIDVREQRAELARAEAGLREKQASFERLRRLRESNYIDEASLETASAEQAIAESEVELWRTRVDFGTVASSIDGTVVVRHVEPGEAVARHEPLFSIADLSNLVVRLGLSERDVGRLAPGDAVPVRVDAVAEGASLRGVIRRVFPAADADSRLVTVEVELPEAGRHGVRPGYLARARLLVDQREHVLAVPAGSVAETRGEYFVMVIDDEERLERRVIEPGILRGAWREVSAGLVAGERVVAANPMEMKAGERVRVIEPAG